jgi:hypothetical protein
VRDKSGEYGVPKELELLLKIKHLLKKLFTTSLEEFDLKTVYAKGD